MATGALDANGIWQYGEDDSETTFSGLLNKLASSTSDTVTRLEGFTGYTGTLPIANGGTGSTTVAAAQDSLRIGLVPISPTSVAQSGGSASANTLGLVTFSNVTSLSLNGVFTTTFNTYRVVLSAGQSVMGDMIWRWRSAGTNDTTAAYTTAANRVNGNAGAFTFTASGQNYAPLYTSVSGVSATCRLDILNPAFASPSTFTYQAYGHDGNNHAAFHGGSVLQTTGSHDGFTLALSLSGNISGTVQVFGYKT